MDLNLQVGNTVRISVSDIHNKDLSLEEPGRSGKKPKLSVEARKKPYGSRV